MPIDPDEISLASIPRTPLGGIRAAEAEELVQRVAWDYRSLLGQNTKLAAQVEELTGRVAELEGELASLRKTLEARKDPDELARTLLSSAQLRARELRETSRREGELALKKARARAAQLEEEQRGRVASARGDLDRLSTIRTSLAGELRARLESILALAPSRDGENT